MAKRSSRQPQSLDQQRAILHAIFGTGDRPSKPVKPKAEMLSPEEFKRRFGTGQVTIRTK